MPERGDFLVEIGTEELPPKALCGMARAFRENLLREVAELELACDPERARWFASPRRMAVLIEELATVQPDRREQRLGPNVQAAFDADGNPTRAAEGFARSCGVAVEDLAREATDKGERLAHTRIIEGRPASELLLGAVERAVDRLPTPRPMRWGDREVRFIRPVHWVVMLLDEEIVPGTLLGQRVGRESRGHRFHHPAAVPIEAAGSYREALAEAKVIVDFEERMDRVATQVREVGQACGGRAVMPPELLEEVANLVEWPQALAGEFDADFLQVPADALISSMENHQKFFPVVDEEGSLLPRFVGVANIESLDPDEVARGYSRVIRPRLADARFFWDVDRKTPLAERLDALEEMVYQIRLGSIGDKVARVEKLAGRIAVELDADPELATRAARLSKCDLLTEMVGEFPELQGIMGRHYALHDGEHPEVARAIEEHYRPRFGGDELPESPLGRVLAIADRVDTLAGIFAAGLRPSGNKDPFALRRAALALARLLIEGELDLDIEPLFESALGELRDRVEEAPAQLDAVIEFVFERMRAYYADQGIGTEVFNAVLAARPTRLLDFDRRLKACQNFATMEEAEALAAANKRIGNILRKAEIEPPDGVDPALLEPGAEQALSESVAAAESEVAPLVSDGDYRAGLVRLSELRPVVDRFFDDVLVMADDEAVRANRLALLARLKGLFDNIADIAQLAQAR